MSVATLKRRVAVLVAAPIAVGGLTLAGAAWTVAGLQDQPSHKSPDVTIQKSGDRVTGSLGSAQLSNDDGWRTTDEGGWRGN
jgi:hypothetical protein